MLTRKEIKKFAVRWGLEYSEEAPRSKREEVREKVTLYAIQTLISMGSVEESYKLVRDYAYDVMHPPLRPIKLNGVYL